LTLSKYHHQAAKGPAAITRTVKGIPQDSRGCLRYPVLKRLPWRTRKLSPCWSPTRLNSLPVRATPEVPVDAWTLSALGEAA